VCGDETHQGRVPIGRLAEAVILFASTLNARSLNDWNDKSDRTRADVLAAFDAAIASTLQRGEGQVRNNSA
jgi:tRNA A37 threonylcarbamoyladenosine synthetase subunit TsaC/SUA5/YrdC